MKVQEMRRRLGRARDRLLHGRRNRRLAEAAVAARTGWIVEAARALTPLPEPAEVEAEVHTLCGEGQAAMGIWAGWSMMRFLPRARLVLHSDGTLTAETIALWRRLMPGTRVLSPEESEAAVAARLAAFPHVLDWTRRYHFGSKLGAFYAAAETPRLVDMDSDVLVLDDPVAVRACLASESWRMAWNRDARPCYAYPEALLREVVGARVGPLPDRLNGGFMVAWRLNDEDWAFLDAALAALAADPRTDPLRYWMHQTLFALLASTQGEAARPLPPAYDIHMGATRAGAAARHYVGDPGVRPRFFTEGVPAVIRDARARGQLPDDFCAGLV
ncbi:hypothetical protein [Roseitranquillus sediminis]|uniref:hypothetical protein n=1 Tax=Roseitranquillus sediminis TaxID=2809051 RepID=UPI001D0C3D64|nr:hypothetical protein [Roseitranquillus sediminis]MBM9593922.1 hypothetical protein [Roseitranquillus sediminis]